MKRINRLFFLLVFTLGLPALADSELDTAKSKKISMSASANHYTGFSADIDPSTLFTASASYQLNDDWKFSVIQWLDKKYYTRVGENQWSPTDTRFAARFKLPKKDDGINLAVSAELTAPISKYSVDNGHISKPVVRLHASKKFFNNKLSVSLVPSYHLYLNQFKSTRTEPGSGGGNPMLKTKAGASLATTYSFSDIWSSTFFTGWNRLDYESTNNVNVISKSPDADLAKHSYFFDLSVSASIYKIYGMSLGYYQGSMAEKYGQVEISAFHPNDSVWYLSGSVSL